VRCPTCGTPAVPGARFCFSCGMALEDQRYAGDGERRVVTVLFGDLSDFTSWAEERDPERVGALTDRVLAACADAVTEVSGHVDKLTGDGIMAVFGAPVAHEDDPERAVRAAHAMQAAVVEILASEGADRRLGLRVGINTGEVLSGVRAGVSYTVIGDAVNTAARLSDAAAPGGVLAGRETALATMPVAAWSSLSPLRLKGKREPVAAYELVGLRPGTGGEPRPTGGEEVPLIGRDGEVGVIFGRLRTVTAGREPATVFVTGDAGLGKSRLVAEVARQAAREVPGLRVLWGRCAPYGVGRELSVVLDVVRGACGVGADVGDVEEAAARVRRSVDRLAAPPWLADRLLSLLALSDQRAPSVAIPGPEVGPRLTQELDAVAVLLAALSEEAPLLLCLDDLQWATDVTLEVLAVVGAQLSGRVMVLGAGRPELLHRGTWWRRLPRAEVIPLGPLDRTDAVRLVRAHLGGLPDEETVKVLLEKAQGNPFFLAELLHLLVDTGLLSPSDQGWRLVAPLPEELLPAGVQAVLAARIDSLDPTARAVLRDASVLGERVPVAALQALSRQPGSVPAAVATLVARGLLRPSPEDPASAGIFVPAHTLAREAAYAGVPKAERARRHALAARWSREGLPPGAISDRAVATHAERAVVLAQEMGLQPEDPAWGVQELGFQAWTSLARAARARDDNLGAERLLRRALELGSGVAAASALLGARVQLAEVLAALWRLEEAQEELSDAVLAEGPVRAGALVVLGDIRRKQGREDEATEVWVQALAAASDEGLFPVASEAIRNLGLQDYFAGRLAAAEEHFEQALDLARQVEDPRAEGWALQHLAWSATSRGAYTEAGSILQAAHAVFAAVDDDGGVGWVLGTEAFVCVLSGQLHRARALLVGLEDSARAAGDLWALAACNTLDAISSVLLGEVRHGAARAAAAEEGFAALADAWGSVLALVAHGMAHRAMGLRDSAVEKLERAVTRAEASRNPLLGLLALVVAGRVHLDGGEVELADQAARRARVKVTDARLEPTVSVGLVLLEVDVLRHRGQPSRALELLQEHGLVPARAGMLTTEREVCAAHAWTLLDLGRVPEALAVALAGVHAAGEDLWSEISVQACLGDCWMAQGAQDQGRRAYAEAAAGLARLLA
jgi:class 3 adenylate cyclase/tetratricopeptide (TPR) repeat protein